MFIIEVSYFDKANVKAILFCVKYYQLITYLKVIQVFFLN